MGEQLTLSQRYRSVLDSIKDVDGRRTFMAEDRWFTIRYQSAETPIAKLLMQTYEFKHNELMGGWFTILPRVIAENLSGVCVLLGISTTTGVVLSRVGATIKVRPMRELLTQAIAMAEKIEQLGTGGSHE